MSKIRLYKLHVDNFKSLNKFSMEFADFSCLIGLNSSGKSTILQSVDFISQQMHGNISQWLDDRGWEANELSSKLTKKKNIIAVISFEYDKIFFLWSFTFNPTLKRCTSESIYMYDEDISNKQLIFDVKDAKYMIFRGFENNDKFQGDIIQDYEGSFLADLKSELLPPPIIEFKKYLKNIYSLDLLSPHELRKRSRAGGRLGLNGANLSAFLNSFNEEEKESLLLKLKQCYHNVNNFNLRKSKGGWSRLELTEKFRDTFMTNEAKYLNDGILRLIAILAQLQGKKSILLFDEVENGINSELVEFLIDTLIQSEHQIMITTHSPMILNYIEDDIAEKSVHYIYKNDDGFTQSIPFFNIPTMKEKLEFMGPGEAYIDTNLTDLIEEIKSLEEHEPAKNNK